MCRKLFLLVCFVLVLGFAGKASAVIYNEDIGNAALLPGSASELGGVWTIEGSGGDIWGNGDNEGFHYVFQPVSGDCTLEINLLSMDVTDYWAKVGVMIRETTDAGSKHAAMVMTENAGALQFVFRQNTGGGSASQGTGGISLPKKLRIVREGPMLIGQYEVFPGFFGETGRVTIPMNEDVLIGMAVCSHRTDLLCTAVMDSVIWSVTPCYRAWAQSPAEGATGLPQEVTLSWRPGEGATSHDVYLGTNPAALLLVATKALGDESFDTGTLEGNTEYFWRVDEHGASVTPGNVWSFKTAKLLRPGTGTILREIWEGIGGGAVWDLTNNAAYPDSPTWSDEITAMDSPDLGIDNYGGRMQGWLVPETDGWCTFWIAADDGSELWLSTTNKSGSAVRIAHWASGYSGNYDAHPEQTSVPIFLEGGEKYFIRALWKEGGGGDWCSVAWQGPDTDEGPRVVIDGYYLGAGYVDLWAYNPSPALGATRVPLDAELSWSAGEDANSHEVYFGTNPVALTLVATKELGDESYEPPLELNTIYYWQINEVNGLDVQAGDVWYFSTPRVNPLTGTIARDVWTGMGGVAVSDLTGNPAYPDDPTYSDERTLFEAPTDFANDFGSMMEGYLLPETDGLYRFWIASDDNSELWLSTDDDPANTVLLASVPNWTSSRQWDKYGEQTSVLIPLLAETRYYIRALYKEGGGGDNCAVAWSGPDTGGSQEVIDGYYLMPRDWASDPFPKNGSTLATREAELNGLSWSVVGNYADSYDIYLGTSPVLTIADLIDTKLVGDETCATGPLVEGTYFWRVDQVGPGGTIPGHVWTFTTAEWVGVEVGGSWGGSYEVDSNGVWTIVGDGGDIWGGGDNFYFVYQMPRLLPSGDVTLIARVESITGGNNSWRKAGMMVRESLDGGSRNACIMMTPPDGENRIAFQSRPETNGGSGSAHYNGIYTPEWVKLVRNGDMFTGFHAEDVDGSPGEWRQVGGPRTVVMPKDVYVGMAVTSHNWGQLTTAVMDNIDITPRDPQQAWGPSPADGAEGVIVVDRGKGVTPVKLLNWEEGDDAVGHLVWFSDNYEDVASGAPGALKALTTEPNYDPGILDLTETYYWAIDEISSRYGLTLGDIWSFTMSDYRLIDDFERYDIIPVAPPNYIEEPGYTADPIEPPGQVPLPPVLIDDGAVIVFDDTRGNVLSLDGDGDYVDCGNPAALNFGTGDWSVSVWIKSTVGDDQGAVFANGGDGGGGHRYTLGLGESNDDKITLVVDDNASKKSAHSGTNVADDAWHNVIGVRDVNIIRVYIDGIPDGTEVIPDGYDLSGTSQREVLIGAIWHHGDNRVQKHYTGLIDEVRVYDYALSEDNALFLAENGGTAPPIVPLAYWPFDVDFNDYSGNGFDGTPHGYLLQEGFAPMLAYYRFDDDTGNDSSGNERHGTIKEKGDWPKFVDSKAGLGRAIKFNDDGAHVLVSGTGSYLDGLSELTVSAWIKSDRTDRDEGWVHFGTNWSDRRSFRYDRRANSSRQLKDCIKYGVATNEGNEEDESSNDVQTKNWQHVAMTWQSGVGIKLYIDGVLDNPGYSQRARGGVTSGYSQMFIGKGSKDNSAGESWKGLIDEVRIYNIALSYGHIRWLAEEPPLDIPPVHSPLIAEYMFDADARDTSGNEYHGTLEGGAYVSEAGVLELDEGAYVRIGNHARFNPERRPFSISAWVKIDRWVGNWGTVIISKRGENRRGWQLRRLSGNNRLSFTTRNCGDQDGWGSGAPDFSLDEWHHVLAVRDGETKCIYVDGEQQAVSGICDYVEWSGHDVYIGCRSNGDNRGREGYFDGSIDEVRVYDKAVTDPLERLYVSGFEATTILSDTWTDIGEVSSVLEGVQNDIAVGGSPHWGERTIRVDCNGDGEVSRVAPFEDWYDGESKTLVLYFKGDSDNAPEDMYVKISSAVGGDRSSQLSYDGDINDLKIPVWQEWNIDLAELGSGEGSGEGVPLPHIGEVAIGLTGTGTMYFDDLRLMMTRCVPKYGPFADFTNDCKVDLKDLRVITDDWLYEPNDNGLWYEYYEGYWGGSGLPYFNVLMPVKQGPVNNFDIGVRRRNDGFAFRFTGLIDAPADANYTFYTDSDDGSKLYIGDVEVVNNDGWHGMDHWREGTIYLTAGKHPITVTMFEDGGGEGLQVEVESAELAIPRMPIPDDVLYRLPNPPSDLSGDNRVNFYDYGILADQWLDEVLFP